MINFLSNCLADFLCSKEIISKERKEIYVYGYQILFSSFFGILSVLTLSIVFSRWMDGLLFLVIFITTRQYSGGFHANHFFTCILSFTGIFLAILYLQSYFIQYDFLLYYVFMLVFFVLTIIKYAPMEHPNKPLSPKIQKINKYKACILSAVWILLFIILYRPFHGLAIIIPLTLASIAALMLLEILIKEVKQ